MDFRRRQQLMTLALAAGLVVVFAAALAVPGTRRLRELRQRSLVLVHDHESFAGEYASLAPQLAEDIERLRGQVAEAIKRVPPEDIRVDFEQALWRLGERHGLLGPDFFQTTSYERDGSITVRGAKLRFTCNFVELHAFLEALQQDEKLTVVHALDMQPSVAGEGLFGVNMELKYFYGEL